MKIILPNTDRRRALIIVDVQPQMMSESTQQLIPRIVSFLERTNYDLYIEATWSADEQSTFFRQTKDLHTRVEAGETAKNIVTSLKKKGVPIISHHKNTRSAFKPISEQTLLNSLKMHRIEEVHLLGLDINDCVLGTAYDAADLGFYTFVIEELSHHSQGLEDLKNAALQILRRQGMTNNSLLPDCPTVELTL